MRLSKNFTLQELTKTSTGLPNIPGESEICNLIALCNMVLQPTRDIYGKPIFITSGYRSPILNKYVGGSKTSAHLRGGAADLNGGSRKENKKLYEIIRDNCEFRQLIWERGSNEGPDWVHVEYRINDNKKQELRI